MKDNSSPISKTKEYLMYGVTRTLKVKRSLSIREMVVPIRDGRLSMLIKQLRNQPQDWMKSLDLSSASHSILSQDCQWRELLNQ
jgi:hypothetical protein